MDIRNKKAQVALFGLLIAVFLIISAIVLISPLKDVLTIAREPTSLDCDNTSISTGQSAACLIVDLILPYFVGAVIIAGVGYIFLRRVSS